MNIGRLAARVGPSMRAAPAMRTSASVRAATTDAVPKAADGAPKAAGGEDNELIRLEKRMNEVKNLKSIDE